MAAALALLAGRGDGRRRVAVLGEMRELGPDAALYHDAIVPLIQRQGVDRVHVLGDLYAGLGERIGVDTYAGRADSLDALKANLASDLRDRDVVLIKGSHSTGLHELVTWLKAESRR